MSRRMGNVHFRPREPSVVSMGQASQWTVGAEGYGVEVLLIALWRTATLDKIPAPSMEECRGCRKGFPKPDYFFPPKRRRAALSSLYASSSEARTIDSSWAGGMTLEWKSPTTLTPVFGPFGL